MAMKPGELALHDLDLNLIPYLVAIEPFRRFILYPAMFRRIRRAWLATYPASG